MPIAPDRLRFLGGGSCGEGLWRTDGSASGTYVLADVGTPNVSNGVTPIIPWAGGVITTMTSTARAVAPLLWLVQLAFAKRVRRN